ncbi:MAG: hypothetical protein A3E87_01355 [Gammaproteobacteria bacterium RIFCSPHIGHO2_12_FULL_35_23]|nr:MAG: hypothetical protein A3E87_01355 [Gammaproteobacteria bacterium RIFCSPHIGHO2_12_FULL_35_23]
MKGINFNTLDKLPLISHTDLQNLFAFKNNQPITCLDFLSDVYFLAELLPKSKYIINLCEDRYKFSVLFSAALLCNRITLLPNNNSSQSLQQLQSEFTDSIIWRDNQIPDLIHQHDVNSNPLTIPSINKDQLVVILYTSGSTGKPIPWKKYWGELVQHSQLTAKALGLNLQEKLQIVTTVATQHMYGLEHAILLPMQMGYIINNLKPFFAGDLITIPSPVNYKTILFSTPLHLKLFAENSNRYPTLRLLVSATAHLTTELATSLEKKFKAILIEIYGCTEAGCIATRQTTQTNHWLLLSNYQLEQVVNNYYLLTPSLNTKKLNRIKLADHLQIIDSQHFILQGRRAENINIAGKRMSLADLNIKLNSIPGIEDGIFYCPTNKEETKRLMALVVAPTLSTSDIRKALRQMIDPVFLPRPLIKLNKLPRNDTGKLPVEAVNSILKEYTEVVENY